MYLIDNEEQDTEGSFFIVEALKYSVWPMYHLLSICLAINNKPVLII